MKELNLLKQLQNISSTNEKVAFVSEHKDNPLFIKLLKFIVDDKVVTNISRAKFNKNVGVDCGINNIDEFLYHLEYISTGKDSDLMMIHGFIDEQEEEYQPILSAIACKDFALGLGTKLYNKAVNKIDVILDFPYMGAVAYDSKKVTNLFKTSDQIESQMKMDGAFFGIAVTDSKITFYLRSGLQAIINGGNLVDELKKLRELESYDFLLNGEILIKGIEDRATANGIIRGLISSNTKINNGDYKEANKFQKKYGMTIEEVEDRLVYYVWDFLDIKVLNGLDVTPPYHKRFSILQHYLKVVNPIFNSIKIVPSKRVENETEAMEHFQELLSKGFEGTILKDVNKPFKSGKPVHNIKFKMVMEFEMKIIGFEIGAENTRLADTLGTIVAQSECGILTNRIGGISDDLRCELWSSQDKYLGKIITVKANGISRNKENGYGLLYANLVEIRDDKDKADTLEEIIEIQNAVLGVK